MRHFLAFSCHLDINARATVLNPPRLLGSDPFAKHTYQRATASYLQTLEYHYRNLDFAPQHGIHPSENSRAQRHAHRRTLSRHAITHSNNILPRQPKNSSKERDAKYIANRAMETNTTKIMLLPGTVLKAPLANAPSYVCQMMTSMQNGPNLSTFQSKKIFGTPARKSIESPVRRTWADI